MFKLTLVCALLAAAFAAQRQDHGYRRIFVHTHGLDHALGHEVDHGHVNVLEHSHGHEVNHVHGHVLEHSHGHEQDHGHGHEVDHGHAHGAEHDHGLDNSHSHGLENGHGHGLDHVHSHDLDLAHNHGLHHVSISHHSASKPDDVHAKVLSAASNIHHHGFDYHFATSNGISTKASGDKHGRIHGDFQWLSPEGENIGVGYVADETGYHPSSHLLPTPPPIPKAILKSLKYNEDHPYKEEEQHYHNHDNQHHANDHHHHDHHEHEHQLFNIRRS